MNALSKPELTLPQRVAVAVAAALIARAGRLQGLALGAVALLVSAIGKSSLREAVDIPLLLAGFFAARFYRTEWPFVEWLARQQREEALDPTLPIVDPHHHLWDICHEAGVRGWPIPKGMGPTALATIFMWSGSVKLLPAEVFNTFGMADRNPFFVKYHADDYVKDMKNQWPEDGKTRAAHNIIKTVYLECGWHNPPTPEHMATVGEVDFARSQGDSVASSGIEVCAGTVAAAELPLGTITKECLSALAAKGVRSIRLSLAYSPPPSAIATPLVSRVAHDGISRSETFRAAFSLLEEHHMTFDTWCYQSQLDELYELAKANPNTVVVADHVGGVITLPGYLSGPDARWKEWEAGMSKLSTLPNVRVKLSGLAMKPAFGHLYERLPQPPGSARLAADWGPYILRTIELFGVQRCMFASNFPVDKLCGSFTVLFNAYKMMVSGFSECDKAALFHNTATNTYKL